MRSLFNIIILSSIVLSSTSCITMQPPEDPVRRAALEQKFIGKSDAYRSRGTFKKPADWKVGQYITVGTTENGVRKAITRTSIIDKEAAGYVLEMITDDARQQVGQQMLVKGLDSLAAGEKNADDFEIIWVRMLSPNGKVQRLDGPMIALMSRATKSTLTQMFTTQPEEKKSSGGTITVPAGTFKKTTQMDSVVSVMGMTFRSTVHLHPDVPINGVVRSESSDGKSVSELLDFGKSGAKPSF